MDGLIAFDDISALRYEIINMIRSFHGDEAERIFRRQRSRRLPPDIQRSAQRKLAIIDTAEYLEDLRSRPGNRLEQLSGTRSGQYSIRSNDRWRIWFRWADGGADAVEITDYH